MKKWFLLFLGLGVLAFPWACGNSPTSPVATPTFTPTPTNWGGYPSTVTRTFTLTATPTITATATATNQNGFTSTPTLSFTPSSDTPTSTLTITNTITNTNTITLTYTPTTTNTAVPTSTPAQPFKVQWTPFGLQYPNGVAVSGVSVYVAEGNASAGVAQVEIYILSGSTLTYVTKWTSFGSTNFAEPYGVAAMGTTVFVLDKDGGSNGTGVLYAYTSAGATLASIDNYSATSFSYPEGVAVDSSGTTVYLSDTGNNIVDQFSFSGTSFNPVAQWTAGAGSFSTPSGVAVDSSGNLYVADSGNQEIQKFNYGGNTWSDFASTNNFSSASDVFGVGVDSTGNVYACDVANSAVQQFTPGGASGSYVAAWFGGSGAAAFRKPRWDCLYRHRFRCFRL